MNNIAFKPKEIIFAEGAAADKMYIVKTGKVGIYAKYGTQDESLLATAGAGKFFGEMGVIDNAPRSATVVAEKKTTLIEIKADQFAGFVKSNPDDVIDMMGELSKRLRKTTKYYYDILRDIEYFMGEKVSGGPDTKDLEELAESAKILTKKNGAVKNTAIKTEYKAGEVIFKKGEKASNFFKIVEGEVGFYFNYGKKSQVELATSGAGEVFGEMAVIEEERRSATAVAKTDVKLISVAQSGFSKYIEENPDVAIAILKTISGKLRDTTNSYIDALRKIADYITEAQKTDPDASQLGIYKYASLYNGYVFAPDGIPYDFYSFRAY